MTYYVFLLKSVLTSKLLLYNKGEYGTYGDLICYSLLTVIVTANVFILFQKADCVVLNDLSKHLIDSVFHLCISIMFVLFSSHSTISCLIVVQFNRLSVDNTTLI